MALETLTNCSCLIIKDLLRNQTAKFKPDTILVKRLKSQQIFIESLKAKVDNTPTCKP